MSKNTVNTARTDKMFNGGRQEDTKKDENRKFYLQVINDFDGRVGNKLFSLRARLDESWDNEESRASPQLQEQLAEEIRRLSLINENLEKRQRSLEQKVKKPKKSPHERMLRCVSKRFRKLKKSVEEMTGKSSENSTADTDNYKMDTQNSSSCSSRMSTPSLLQWSSAKSPLFSGQEAEERAEYQHASRWEDNYSVGVAKGIRHTSPRGQRFKFRCRTKSEIKNDPNFSTYLLEWPPTGSTLKPALRKSAADQEPTQRSERDVSIAGMFSTPKVPRVSFKTRTISEIKRDPDFSSFLMKWPPECSALKPIPKKCGTNKHSANWEKEITKGHKLVGRFDHLTVRMPSTKPCEMLTRATHEQADSRFRSPSRPQTQHKLLGGHEIPHSCEDFIPKYTPKSAITSQVSWGTEGKECLEDLSSFQSQKSGIQHRAAEVSKQLEQATTAQIYWMNHNKELENVKSLKKEFKKIEPRHLSMVSQGKEIYTKKFKRK